MTEETNEAAAAAPAEAAPVEVPAEALPADAATEDVSATAERIVHPTEPPNPPDPIPDPPESTTIDLASAAAVDEAELARISESERQKALADDPNAGGPGAAEGGADQNADTQVNDTAAKVVTPFIGIGQRVFLRLEKGGSFDTPAIVTKYDNDNGIANVTAFPDGEVPRPIGAVPYVENAPDVVKTWTL